MIYDFFLLLKNPFLRKRAFGTWLAWITLTTVGWFFAGLTSLPIGRVVIVEGGTAAILSVAASMGLIGALIGALASTGQWFFFRLRFGGAYRWLLATSFGWGIGLPFALIVNLMLRLGISAGLYGLFVGASVAVMQWVLYRKVVPEFFRWLAANLLAFVLGISGAGWLERAMLMSTQGAWGAQAWHSALTSGLAGIIVGVFTGIAMTTMIMTSTRGNGQRNA